MTEASQNERVFTFADVLLISMFARLEGAPSAEEIVRDLDVRGKLSSPKPPCPSCGCLFACAPGCVEHRAEVAAMRARASREERSR